MTNNQAQNSKQLQIFNLQKMIKPMLDLSIRQRPDSRWQKEDQDDPRVPSMAGSEDDAKDMEPTRILWQAQDDKSVMIVRY